VEDSSHATAARPALQLTFLGGNATVTGSRTLVECGGHRVLVDCGLFQGYKSLRLRNWAPFPLDPKDIDAVVLTHAHLDHSGYLPRLIREGFNGRVWCTPATADLCRILLPDSGHLLEEEAVYANRRGSSRHHPALPLYTQADARASLRHLQAVPFGQAFEPAPGFTACFSPQGHILGAAAVALGGGGCRIVFSGDVGRPHDPVMRAPEPPPESDWMVVESTYGNRRHLAQDLQQELGAALDRVLRRGGVAVIPAFAVGRAQLLLHAVTRMQEAGTLPRVPVYLNSPMATDVTALYARYRDDHRIDDAQLRAMQRTVRIVNSAEESKALNRRRGPMVIVAASGMATGGRVLHHLVAFAPDPRNMIVLSGYQAGGTRGASLARGDREVRIYGVDVAVRAEVVQLQSASAHADADELLAWLRAAPVPPRRVFINHGEPDAAEALRLRIQRELQWDAHVPEHGERVALERDASADRRGDASPASQHNRGAPWIASGTVSAS
jgi:metallo-beta-lactamase family protein